MAVERLGARLLIEYRRAAEPARSVLGACQEQGVQMIPEQFPRLTLLCSVVIASVHTGDLSADDVIEASFPNVIFDAQSLHQR